MILPAVSKSKTENNSQQLLTDTNPLKTPGSIVVLPDNIMEKVRSRKNCNKFYIARIENMFGYSLKHEFEKMRKYDYSFLQIKEDLLPNQVKLKEDSKNVDNSKLNHDSQDSVSELRNSAKSPTKHLTPSFETGNGLRSRKPCNCTRSQCLKL